MADKPGTAVAIPDEQYGMAVAAIVEGKPLPDAADPEAVSRAILERILEAETFEEAFKPQAKLRAWRENLDRPAKIQSVHFNRTGIADAQSAIYAVVDLVWTDTGEQETVSVGGRNVLAQLLTGLRKGWFPSDERQVVLRDKEASSGYRVLWLEDAYADNPLDQV